MIGKMTLYKNIEKIERNILAKYGHKLLYTNAKYEGTGIEIVMVSKDNKGEDTVMMHKFLLDADNAEIVGYVVEDVVGEERAKTLIIGSDIGGKTSEYLQDKFKLDDLYKYIEVNKKLCKMGSLLEIRNNENKLVDVIKKVIGAEKQLMILENYSHDFNIDTLNRASRLELRKRAFKKDGVTEISIDLVDKSGLRYNIGSYRINYVGNRLNKVITHETDKILRVHNNLEAKELVSMCIEKDIDIHKWMIVDTRVLSFKINRGWLLRARENQRENVYEKILIPMDNLERLKEEVNKVIRE